MKRTNGRKLSLNRETLASLNADDLARVNGGDIGSRPVSLTTTSRIGCPSRLPTVCPTGDSQVSVPPSRMCSAQGQ